MDNEALREVFINLHAKIIQDVTPDSVIDVLLSKKIISTDDYDELLQAQGAKKRCRALLSRLYRSSHPQAFIELRLALVDEYSWIVDEIDEKLTSLTVQHLQVHQSHSADGKFVLAAYSFVKVYCAEISESRRKRYEQSFMLLSSGFIIGPMH